MESIKQKNLYITGELLDADGECGGFNLGFAWITGYLAGTGVNNDQSKTNKTTNRKRYKRKYSNKNYGVVVWQELVKL